MLIVLLSFCVMLKYDGPFHHHCTMYRKRFLEMGWVGHFLHIVKWQVAADQLANLEPPGAGTS